jgi:hypothetical protein
MKVKIVDVFRILFAIGCILLVCSLFLGWYSFQMFTLDNELLVSWDYFIFSGWQTDFSESSTLNDTMKPDFMMMPLIINILLFMAIILAGYVIIFHNIEKVKETSKNFKYGYILALLLMLVFYYAFISPALYLIPKEFYFPIYRIVDSNLGYIYSYSVGLGFAFQLLSFPLLFPYCIFYFSTINNFIQEEKTPEKYVEQIKESVYEDPDLDKKIAEEQLKLQMEVIKK